MHFEQLLGVLNSKNLPAYSLPPHEFIRHAKAIAARPSVQQLLEEQLSAEEPAGP